MKDSCSAKPGVTIRQLGIGDRAGESSLLRTGRADFTLDFVIIIPRPGLTHTRIKIRVPLQSSVTSVLVRVIACFPLEIVCVHGHSPIHTRFRGMERPGGSWRRSAMPAWPREPMKARDRPGRKARWTLYTAHVCSYIVGCTDCTYPQRHRRLDQGPRALGHASTAPLAGAGAARGPYARGRVRFSSRCAR